MVLEYFSLGCWKDKSDRAIKGGLNGPRVDDSNSVHACFERAQSLGYTVFALQDGNQCFTSKDAGKTYNKYGTATNCKNGKGGDWANAVYKIGNEAFDSTENFLYPTFVY